jgi:ribosomal protein S18 acetylase RimI-like enzyme
VSNEKQNHPNISLRRAEAADARFLEAVYADSRRDELGLFGWTREQEDAFFKMQFDMQTRAYRMQFPDAAQNIICLGEKPVGRLIVKRGEREIRLIDISILAEFRGRGIGNFLIEKLKTEAVSGKVLVLQVLKTNEQAKRFYARLGLTVAGESDLYYVMKWSDS